MIIDMVDSIQLRDRPVPSEIFLTASHSVHNLSDLSLL